MQNLYLIGKVAERLKISTRTIRFYEEKGLITPSEINNKTGYRFFDSKQILQLKKILFLKDLNFSLEEIKNYLNCSIEEQKHIVFNKHKSTKIHLDFFNKIEQEGLYNLSFLDDKFYYGNDVKIKNLQMISGVWQLNGMYANIKDAKTQHNALNYFTPYKFLAFKNDGLSPWFYYATNKKIVFNTFYLPVSELYQIIDNKLYLSIINPDDHIFINNEKCNPIKHILVFEKFSENYEDYNKLTYHDTLPTNFILDKKVIGFYRKVGLSTTLQGENKIQSLDNEFLIFYENGILEKISKDKFSTINWTKGFIYDKNKMFTYKYNFNDKDLIVENKTNTYKFTGEIKNYLVYNKISLK